MSTKTTIQKSWETLLKILTARKLSTENAPSPNKVWKQFENTGTVHYVTTGIAHTTAKLNPEWSNARTHVFLNRHTLTTRIIMKYVEEWNGMDDIILAITHKRTHTLKKVENKTDYKIQCFPIHELQFFKCDHILVPKHRKLTLEEFEEFVATHIRHGRPNLPQLLVSDPIVRIYGGQPGDVFEIIRYNQYMGVSPYYRTVIFG